MRTILSCAVAIWLCHSSAEAQQIIRVPAATSTPVLIDGEMATDEWADAREVVFGDSLRMYVKHRDGHVFLAIRQNTRTPRMMDVFIIPSDGKVHQVHASMSTGERVLEIPFNDTVPGWDWNRHPDWTANDAEFDRSKPETLSFSDRLIERDGVEFQLRRTRFGGRQWRVRVEVGSFPGREGLDVYPAQSDRNRPDTWALFEFESTNSSADAATLGGGLARTGVFPVSGIRETPRLRWKFDTRGIVWGPIVAANGTAYFGSQDSSFYAVDIATGRARWSIRTAGGNSSGPTIVGNTVYFGGGDAHVYALNVADGSLRWRFQTGARIISSPAVLHNVVYVGSDDGHVYALDAESGREVWRHKTGGRVTAPPAIVGGIVYVSGHDRTLYALSARDGRVLWTSQADAGLAWSPIVLDDMIISAALNGRVRALDRNTRQERWQFQTGAWIVGVGADAKTVYFGSGDSTFYALDRATGRERWRFETGGGINLVPAIVGDVIYTGSHDGRIYALDTNSGRLLWSFRTNNEVHTAPAVLDGIVIFGSADGSVYALEQPTQRGATSN